MSIRHGVADIAFDCTVVAVVPMVLSPPVFKCQVWRFTPSALRSLISGLVLVQLAGWDASKFCVTCGSKWILPQVLDVFCHFNHGLKLGFSRQFPFRSFKKMGHEW